MNTNDNTFHMLEYINRPRCSGSLISIFFTGNLLVRKAWKINIELTLTETDEIVNVIVSLLTLNGHLLCTSFDSDTLSIL